MVLKMKEKQKQKEQMRNFEESCYNEEAKEGESVITMPRKSVSDSVLSENRQPVTKRVAGG